VSEPDCNGCEGCSRRDFLRDTVGAAVALTVLSGFRSRSVADVLRYPIPASDGAVIDRDNEIIMVRYQRRAYALALSCPHQRTMLKWRPDDARFQCPKHKSKYQPDGTFISGRATRGMDRHAIKLQGRELIVDRAFLYRQDKNSVEWKSAFVAL